MFTFRGNSGRAERRYLENVYVEEMFTFRFVTGNGFSWAFKWTSRGADAIGYISICCSLDAPTSSIRSKFRPHGGPEISALNVKTPHPLAVR